VFQGTYQQAVCTINAELNCIFCCDHLAHGAYIACRIIVRHCDHRSSSKGRTKACYHRAACHVSEPKRVAFRLSEPHEPTACFYSNRDARPTPKQPSRLQVPLTLRCRCPLFIVNALCVVSFALAVACIVSFLSACASDISGELEIGHIRRYRAPLE
jgi:hypothetical protein